METLTLPLPGKLAIAATDEQINSTLGENVLALHELSGMTGVKEVIDAVGVDADRSGRGAIFCHVQGDALGVITSLKGFNGLLVCVKRSRADNITDCAQ